MPTIKELYSLISFNGGFHPEGNSTPYLDTKYFRFVYGDQSKGERPIDCQDWSATEYVSTTMDGNPTVFGVNFADGRIKGYPKQRRGPDGVTTHKLYVRYVRGNPDYGKNDFHDNGDGTIIDRATGLMWSKADSRKGMNWEAALAWVQAKNAEKYLGHGDWRLPNAKELQSIVDYTRAPAVTHSPAIAQSSKPPGSVTASILTSGPARPILTDRPTGKGLPLFTSLSAGLWAGCSSRRDAANITCSMFMVRGHSAAIPRAAIPLPFRTGVGRRATSSASTISSGQYGTSTRRRCSVSSRMSRRCLLPEASHRGRGWDRRPTRAFHRKWGQGQV